MSDAYHNLGFLGNGYQLKLLYNITWDGDFGRKIIPLLQSSYFDDMNYKIIFKLMKNYYEKHEVAPNIDNLEQLVKMEVADDVQRTVLTSHINKLMAVRKKYESGEQLPDSSHIRDTIFKFVRQQEFKRVLAEGLEKLENGDLDTADEIPDLLRSALLVGNTEDFGRDIHDVDESLFSNVISDVIKTGIGPIDEIIGGLPKGKLGMILAGQGIGKSKILTYLANEAYMQGKNVLHIIFDENSVDEVMKLHYAKWSGVEPDHFPENKERVLSQIRKAKDKFRVGKLVIKRFSSDGTTIPKIKNWIKSYQDMYGLKFDMICIDYIDEVESHKANGDTWTGQADVVKSFHSMLVDLDICGWTATQAKKESNDKRYLVFDDCGGSVAKLKKSQLVIAIGSDLTQKENGLATFTLLKSNFSKCGHIFDDAIFNRGTLKINLRPTSSFIPADLLAQGNDDEDEYKPIAKLAPQKTSVFDRELPSLTPLSSLVPKNTDFDDAVDKEKKSGGLDDLIMNSDFSE
jgi:replicative DNA helicase